MRRKASYDFTARAAEDLREIGRYTRRPWGIAQARHYRQELELALHNLSLNPLIGREREEIEVEIRSFRVAAHVAFYMPRRGGITVIRLLHPSMDVEPAYRP
jgi:toxin ParE1/3/4